MSDVIHLNRSAMDIKGSPEYQPISGVRVIVGKNSAGDDVEYVAGDDSSRMLEVNIPWGTQAIANNILSEVEGFKFKPYTARSAMLDPAAELGDVVYVGDIYSTLNNVETTFSPIMSATISANDDGVIDHEYPYEPTTDRKIDRKIADAETSFIVEMGKVETRISETYETKTDAANTKTELSNTITNTARGTLQTVSENYETISNVNSKVNGALTAANGYTDGIAGNLSTQIETTARGIKTTVASAQLKYDTTGITLDYYGYGAPDNSTAGENKDKTYLDNASGFYYKSNGTIWVKQNSEPLNLVTETLNSKIDVTAGSITSTVAKSVSKYDTSSVDGTIQLFGYGEPSSTYKAADYRYYRYLDQQNGYWYKSNGSRWVKQNNTPLPLITTSLSTQIEQTERDIKLSVNGQYADAYDEWTTEAEDESRQAYWEGDKVKLTTYNGEVVAAINFYECIEDHYATDARKPPNTSYWKEISAPTVQNMIDLGLDGITLSVGSSDEDNSAYIQINKDGVKIDGKTITMSNVVAEELVANVSISSPLIYNSKKNTWIEMENDGKNSGYGAGLRIKRGTSELYDTLFGVFYDSLGRTSIYAMSEMFLAVKYGWGDPDVYAYGNWDFSNATVTGI